MVLSSGWRTMAIPTTILCISYSTFLTRRCLGCNYAIATFSNANSPGRKRVFSKKRVWTSYSSNKRSARTMAFEDGDGDESVRVLEQETLFDGSSEIGSNFAVYQLERTLNSLSKWLVSALFAALVLWRHDAEAMWSAMGSVINVILSITLKRILNQERPVPGMKSDPGMPSSHAQSIFFAVFFIVFSIVEWQGINGYTIIISALALALGSYLSWLRVSQRLHTTSQVVVGAIIGSIFSSLWYCLWGSFVQEAFESSLVVQFIILSVAIGFCAGFLVYVVRYWLRDER